MKYFPTKKTFLQPLMLILTIFSIFFWTGEAVAQPELAGESAVLMDIKTGQIVFEKDADRKLAPASTTKILTALVALERGKLQDKVVIGERPPLVEGTRVYLRSGEEQTLENLLYGALVSSGNDAALAVAEHIGGTEEGFAKMMNDKARELGATNSNFVNPHGLPAEGHYTTARDLALITREAMKDPTFRKIVATWTYPWNGKDWKTTLINHNKMLSQYDDIIGVKTGYTTEAGQCLVAAAQRDNESYIAVVLNSSGTAVYTDARALLDYGFDNYQTIELTREGEKVAQVTVDGQELSLLSAGAVTNLVERKEQIMPLASIRIDELKSPVAQGVKVGELTFTEGNRELAKVDLITGNDVKKVTSWQEWMGRATTAIVLLALVQTVVRWQRRRRRRRQMFSSGRW